MLSYIPLSVLQEAYELGFGCAFAVTLEVDPSHSLLPLRVSWKPRGLVNFVTFRVPFQWRVAAGRARRSACVLP